MEPKASRTTPERSVFGASAKPGSEKGSQPAKAAKRAASDQVALHNARMNYTSNGGGTKVRTLKTG